MNRSKAGVGVLLVLVVAALLTLVPQLAVEQAEAYPGDCILIQNPYWATYTGGESGCEGAAHDCVVWTFECE